MEHLPKKIHQNGISYTLVGDYYIPVSYTHLLPVIVRNMDDDAAVLLMVDSNLQS